MRYVIPDSGGLFQQSFRLLIAVVLLFVCKTSAIVLPGSGLFFADPQEAIALKSPNPVAPFMNQQSVQLDPLDSPFPIPWNWVLAMQAEASADNISRLRYYRTPALISPDGQYAAYSRIQMQVNPDFLQSRVSSVLFIENLHTGDLQTITPTSPFADNPFMSEIEPDQEGTIAILIPVAWAQESDRVLAREFESIFGSDIASDFAVIWERSHNQVKTVAPTGMDYTNAILLGWSQVDGDRVLFRAGNLGDPEWKLWSVDFDGRTTIATEDQPIVFGQTVNNVWSGPQAYR